MNQFPENLSARGEPVTPGDVLCHPETGSRAVVEFVGDLSVYAPALDTLGMALREKDRPGDRRLTDTFSTWIHVPPEHQTHLERLWSWLHTPGHDICAEGGVLAMLPPATADVMDNIELTGLLEAMALHLDGLQEALRASRTLSNN
jgi:hypothetical protein